MEKVLDAGLINTVLAHIQNNVQKQVFIKPLSFKRGHSSDRNQESVVRQSQSDYSAFIKKAKEIDKKRFPSVFDTIKLNTRSPNFQSMESVENLAFPLIGHRISDLIDISTRMIRKGKFDKNSQPDKMKKLVTQISRGYNVVSYHNFTHGVSLMHLLFNCYEIDDSLKQMFTEEQRGYSLIAALAHDINHPGHNNGFQNKMNSELSQIAENDGVLQKMHTRYFFDILKENQAFDLQKNVTEPLKIKEMITRVILSTDIAKHFSNLNKMKNLIETKKLNCKNYDHRYFILQNLFHACDIGNPCIQFKQYISWAALVTYQFHVQTEMEKQNNLEVSQYFQYTGRKNFYQGQISFINGLVYPLWKQLSISWPGLNKLVNNISINLVKLKIEKDSIKEQSEQPLFIEL